MRIWPGILLGIVALDIFVAGAWFHQRYHGTVDLYHDVETGAASLSVHFPAGIAFQHLALYDGCELPIPGQGRWVEILPGGVQKTWYDSLDIRADGQHFE
jgi:hypothetical protein